MKKPSKKTVIIVIIIFFVGVFVWQRFAGKSDMDTVDTHRVSRGRVVEMVSDSGDMRPEKYANLSFEIPTMITSADVAVGDTVTKGQKLITIDRNQLGAQIHAARVDVEQAVAREQLARRHWDALKPEEREQYRKDVERARAMLRATQSQWSKTVLRAPMDGIVTKQEARVRFRSGMNVDVDIVVEEKNDVLQIPMRFVRHDDHGSYVYVQKNIGLEKQYITTGLEGDDGNVEVVEGLQENEEIFYFNEGEQMLKVQVQ